MFVKRFWMALLVIVGIFSLVWSFQDTQNSGSNYTSMEYFNVERAYEFIEEFGVEPHPRGSANHEVVRQGILNELTTINISGAEIVTMDYEFTYEDAQATGSYNPGTVLVTPTLVRNILFYIDRPNSDEAIMFLSHYDSVPMGPGASDDLYGIATMLETLRQYKEGHVHSENDLVFLFSDGEEEGLIGATAFANKWPTQNVVNSRYINLIDKVKFLVNHESRGTGGTLIMFETTPGNYRTIQQFAQINRDVVTNSIANFIYQSMPNGTDYSAFSNLGIQGINVANVGEGYFYHTQADNVDGVDLALLAQHGRLENSVLTHLGDYSLSSLYEVTNDAVFFNYLDWRTFYYSQTVAWILAVLAIALMIIHYFEHKKEFNLVTIGKGLGTQVLAMVASFAAIWLLTQGSALIPSLGLRLSASSYSSPRLLLAALGVGLAAATFIYVLLHRWTKVPTESIVLANTYVFGFLGLLLTFAKFELSYLMVIPALIGAMMWLFNDWLARRGLNLNPLPFATFFYLPLAMPLLVLASDALGAKMYGIISLLAVLTAGFVLPYAAQVTWKLPPLPSVGPLVALTSLVIGMVAATVEAVAPTGNGLSVNLSGKASGRSVLFTDDSLIYEVDQATSQVQWKVVDRDAYFFMQDDLNALDFSYNQLESSYTVTTTPLVAIPTTTPAVIELMSANVWKITVTPLFENSYFTVTIPLTGTTKVEVIENGVTTLFNDFRWAGASPWLLFRGTQATEIQVTTTASTTQVFNYNEYYQFAPELETVTLASDLMEKYPDLRLSIHVKNTFQFN